MEPDSSQFATLRKKMIGENIELYVEDFYIFKNVKLDKIHTCDIHLSFAMQVGQ